MFHVSHITCHLSRAIFHVLCVFQKRIIDIFCFDKMAELVGGGSVITAAGIHGPEALRLEKTAEQEDSLNMLFDGWLFM